MQLEQEAKEWMKKRGAKLPPIVVPFPRFMLNCFLIKKLGRYKMLLIHFYISYFLLLTVLSIVWYGL